MTRTENQSRAALLNRAAARELLRLLEQAQEQAEIVDASRGRTFAPHIALMPGESQGTDLATPISEIAGRVRGEVFGRGGNGEEEKDKPSESETLPGSVTDVAAAIDADIDAEINAQMDAHVNDTAASQTDQTTDDEGPCGR